MSAPVCWSCRSLLQRRLRAQISFLQRTHRCASTNTKQSLSWYQDTTAPTATQLEAAEKFFLTHRPRKLWTATEWRKHNDAENTSLGLLPEVAFLGRSNVGKSSLLNALLVTPALNHVGPRPGKTTTMHAWAVSPTDPKTGGAVKGLKGDMETKCAVLDMPGYGHGSRDDWGEEIMAYLKNRKQLKRAFVLVDGRVGLKHGDLTMLRLLREQNISAQIVVSKCDKNVKTEMEKWLKTLWADIEAKVNGPGLGLLGEVLVVGALGDGRFNDTVHYKNMRGVSEVQWAVLRATGLDKFAVSVDTNPNKSPSTSTVQAKTEEFLLKFAEENEPPKTPPALREERELQRPLQTPTESQPPPAAPFSWPAKVRKPSTYNSKANYAPRPPAENENKASNPTAVLSELFARSMAQEMAGPPPSSPPPRRIPHVEEPKPSPSLWTGSAVGGMADLEEMMSRTSRRPGTRGGHSPSPTKTTAKTITPRRAHNAKSSARSRLSPVSSHANGETGSSGSSSTSTKKEPWSGSAVGGMADLEEMMSRTSTRSGSAGGGGGRRRTPSRGKTRSSW